MYDLADFRHGAQYGLRLLRPSMSLHFLRVADAEETQNVSDGMAIPSGFCTPRIVHPYSYLEGHYEL